MTRDDNKAVRVHPAVEAAVAAVKSLEDKLGLLDEPAQLAAALDSAAPKADSIKKG